MNESELNAEFNRIISNPDSRTNMDALTEMSILIKVFEDKGIKLPEDRKSYYKPNIDIGSNIFSLIAGIMILAVGVLLTIGDNNIIFYGAIITGLGLIARAFVD